MFLQNVPGATSIPESRVVSQHHSAYCLACSSALTIIIAVK